MARRPIEDGRLEPRRPVPPSEVGLHGSRTRRPIVAPGRYCTPASGPSRDSSSSAEGTAADAQSRSAGLGRAPTPAQRCARRRGCPARPARYGRSPAQRPPGRPRRRSTPAACRWPWPARSRSEAPPAALRTPPSQPCAPASASPPRAAKTPGVVQACGRVGRRTSPARRPTHPSRRRACRSAPAPPRRPPPRARQGRPSMASSLRSPRLRAGRQPLAGWRSGGWCGQCGGGPGNRRARLR